MKKLNDYIEQINDMPKGNASIEKLVALHGQLLNTITDIKNQVYDISNAAGALSIYNDADAHWIARIFQAITSESKYGTTNNINFDNTIIELKEIVGQQEKENAQ